MSVKVLSLLLGAALCIADPDVVGDATVPRFLEESSGSGSGEPGSGSGAPSPPYAYTVSFTMTSTASQSALKAIKTEMKQHLATALGVSADDIEDPTYDSARRMRSLAGTIISFVVKTATEAAANAAADVVNKGDFIDTPFFKNTAGVTEVSDASVESISSGDGGGGNAVALGCGLGLGLGLPIVAGGAFFMYKKKSSSSFGSSDGTLQLTNNDHA